MLRTFVCTRVYSPVIGKDKNWPEPKFDESLPKSVGIRMHGALSSIPHPLSRIYIYEKKQFLIYAFVMWTYSDRLMYSNQWINHIPRQFINYVNTHLSLI